MAGGKWSRWGRGGCEGYTLDLGDFINFSLVRKDDHFGHFSHYEGTSHRRKIDEFPTVEAGKAYIEQELESGMRRVLYDWEIYQQNKAKGRKV